jgi:hypothetical protein
VNRLVTVFPVTCGAYCEDKMNTVVFKPQHNPRNAQHNVRIPTSLAVACIIREPLELTQASGLGKKIRHAKTLQTCDRVSGDLRCILCGRDVGVASRVVSSRTTCCLAHLYSECYAFPESLVYAVTHVVGHVHNGTRTLELLKLE